MSNAPPRQKRPPKPPACDTCKARRVLCHPQPNGQSCPRCVEKGIVCTTTPIRRGRPPTFVARASSSGAGSSQTPTPPDVGGQRMKSATEGTLLPTQAYETLPGCPNLTPELVSHLLDCFFQLSFGLNPIVIATSIKPTTSAAGFKLDVLPPQARVLALCMVALGSVISFDEAILGPGPRPTSFADVGFFFKSPEDVRACGVRRAEPCHALRAAALKAAWDAGVMLQVSIENAAACYLLDALDQNDFSGLSRPWATAYMSHIRALAPMWRAPNTPPPYAGHWAGFLMAESLLSTRSRKPILVTPEDQLLLVGPEPLSAEEFLASVEATTNPPAEVLFDSVKPFTLHITRLARQLWSTITGDHVRLAPLSESAVMQFLSSVSLMQAILSHLLSRADSVLASRENGTGEQLSPFMLDDASAKDRLVRGAAYGVSVGFASLVLPAHLEIALRTESMPAPTAHARERMRLLGVQAREMARGAVREFARAIRYLNRVHYAPVQRRTLLEYAAFALGEAEATPTLEPELVRDLETFAAQLRVIGYSLDLFASSETAQLITRLDRYLKNAAGLMERASTPASSHLVPPFNFGNSDYFDPSGLLAEFFLPMEHDPLWMSSVGTVPKHT
ncbi:hypothetical protein C8R46DRAFT_1101593 [Mycena filopes]|nr:hypothetical protein C8R46DRAFT_1140444 [Mycena filopes]KAJ7162815.1 hypothetical protein C8R46DRAFT_1101593 [Mycena filopes]